MDLVATCARGVEALLEAELRSFGAKDVRPNAGAVSFRGDLEQAYRVCLWSRVASRVLLELVEFDAADGDALYAGVRSVRWGTHMGVDDTLAVDCVAAKREGIHTRYYALKTKDAIVDDFREACGRRPNVDAERPDLRVHVHVADSHVRLSIDLAGDAMHRRGYRPKGASAPLKENLAAAILMLAGYPERAAAGAPLVDLMCGSGTLLVEAAAMGADLAPGLRRRHHGFLGWRGHDEKVWGVLLAEARNRFEAARGAQPPVFGYDASDEALRLTQEAARRAEVRVSVERRPLEEAAAPAGVEPGLVVTNPPYGERLGDAGELFPLYRKLGDVLKRSFPGWHAFVLSGNRALDKHLGLRPDARHVLFNGPIECRLLDVPITATPVSDKGPGWRRNKGPEAAMFDNRLKKNRQTFGKWAKGSGITCYRVYDGDIPEFNVAVDIYPNDAIVQEYERPRKIPPAAAEQRLADALAIVGERFGLDEQHVHLRVRRKQRGGSQYQKSATGPHYVEVGEGGHRFLVSFEGYLDTGLFLDLRSLRGRIEREAEGKRFLNLFAYTSTATVYAAAGGARETVTVDLSNTYLDWGQKNLALNGLEGPQHTFERADCLRWLDRRPERFDLVLLNPPSYSRSKGMEGDFDVLRDHGKLVRSALARLTDDGVLYFVTHARGFRLDETLERDFKVQDIAKDTVSKDFARSPHHAFRLQR